jgi:hypothetical protein
MKKTTIKIEVFICNYRIEREMDKISLRDRFIDDKYRRMAFDRPTVSIREFIYLECIAFAYEQIDKQKKGFELGFI